MPPSLAYKVKCTNDQYPISSPKIHYFLLFLPHAYVYSRWAESRASYTEVNGVSLGFI